MSDALLEIEGLNVRFATRGGTVKAVRGVDLTVRSDEVVGVVGESGSGKSAAMLAVMGLLADNATSSGSVRFAGEQLIGAPPARLRSLRGGRVAMVFQDPLTSLNPVLTVGRQVMEAIVTHDRTVSKKEARRRAAALLDLVAIPEAERRLDGYPHEFSGGMRQRVMIAMAMANEPDLLIADEPTTALDVTIQAQILDVLAAIRAERHLAIVLITHDLGVVAGLADTVHVMYAGRVVERGPVTEVFYRAQHPYTQRLLACLPRLDKRRGDLVPIGGAPPSLLDLPTGCSFRPRCARAVERCAHDDPALAAVGSTEAACLVVSSNYAARSSS
jgi:peptide/nickel transport system ATP-binding protein